MGAAILDFAFARLVWLGPWLVDVTRCTWCLFINMTTLLVYGRRARLAVVSWGAYCPFFDCAGYCWWYMGGGFGLHVCESCCCRIPMFCWY